MQVMREQLTGIGAGNMEKNIRPSIVAAIPAYNEEKTIGRVVLLAQRWADKVVVCDDGSKDMTADIAEKMGVYVVKHEKNMGYGAALQSLFKRARELGADILVTLDGDGQHNPSDIPVLIKPILEKKADIVIGSRFLHGEEAKGIPLYRQVGIKAITRLVVAASNCGVSDAQNGFRAYGRRALERLKFYERGMGVSVEILLKAKEQYLRVVEVPVVCNYKGLETSTHAPLAHGVSVLMSIVKLVVEDHPLLFLGMPGAVSLLIGMLFGVWMLQIYALGHRIVTNVALASIAFTLIGLFALFTAITLYAIARLIQKIKT